MNKTEQYKKAVLIALEKSLGVITEGCKKAGVGRTTFYEWLKYDKEFKKQVDEIESIALDFAESQLFKNIGAGKEASLIFYLKTKGRKRGYCEKTEGDFTIKEESFNWDKIPQKEKELLFEFAERTKSY